MASSHHVIHERQTQNGQRCSEKYFVNSDGLSIDVYIHAAIDGLSITLLHRLSFSIARPLLSLPPCHRLRTSPCDLIQACHVQAQDYSISICERQN
jgi:hypothetical protein